MPINSRIEPVQEIQKAPNVNEVHILASDPTNAGKYKHTPLSELGLNGGGTGTFIPPSVFTVSLGASELVSRTFTVMLPTGKTVARVLVFINQAFAFFASVTYLHSSTTVDITVSGYDAIENDSLSLIIFWE